jgi:hypothetical protein
VSSSQTGSAVCTVVLVHSPLVGALTWAATAAELERHGLTTVVADLAGASDHAAIVGAVTTSVTQTAPHSMEPIVLVGHSGAGRHLPGVAAVQPGTALLIYVDAALASPGRSWFDDAPPELASTLRGLADDRGRLPPWSEWFPADALASLLPEPDLRRRFVAGLPRLPLSYFAEPAPPARWTGPEVYIQLSDAYRAEAARLASEGVPVIARPSDHLAMLTDPAMVAAAIRTAIAT